MPKWGFDQNGKQCQYQQDSQKALPAVKIGPLLARYDPKYKVTRRSAVTEAPCDANISGNLV